MSGTGAELGGLVFGFTGASLMFWLGVAGLPFAKPVASWFRARMLTARGMPPLGREAAAENMVPGQIIVGSLAGIVIGLMIIWNSGAKINAALTRADTSASPPLLAIFVGAAALVGGFVLLARAVKRPSRKSRRRVIAGAAIAALGVGSMTAGIVLVIMLGAD